MAVSLSELRELVMDREAWRAALHGVAKSRTRLSDCSDLMRPDVIFLRCADTRRWRKERLCRPSLLLLGCSFGVMAPSLWKGLVGIGLFALAHSAFSAAQHHTYMRLTEKENESLPIDIVLQTLLAFAVTCYGIVHIAGEFKDMDATSELKNKTFDTLRNHPSFYVFHHRGRILFRPLDTTNSSNQDALSSNTSLKLRKLESLHR